ncbi:MAG: histidine phosphatase family protein [Chloroflexi bacterium]|nr:histidine phosphatase family protein [Chloroflexota bacterium]
MADTHAYRFVLLRHGESEGNVQGVHQGQADFPLTPRGRAQARQLAEAWAARGVTFRTIFSSPLARAAETARIVAEVLGIEQIVFDPIWKERDKGQLTGLPFGANVPGSSPTSLFYPVGTTGESLWEVHRRATEAVQRLLENPPGQYLVVSHGGFMNLVIHAMLGIAPQPYPHAPSFRLPNTAYIAMEYRPATHRWLVLGLCHRSSEAAFPCV